MPRKTRIVPSLTAEEIRLLETREYESLVRLAMHSGKGLPVQDQQRLKELAKKLNKGRSAFDPDYLTAALSSGAFRDSGHRPAGKFAVALRHQILAALLVRGWSRERITFFCAENWGVGPEMVGLYLRKAAALAAKQGENTLRVHRGLAAARLTHAYEVAEGQQNPEAMIKAIATLADLLGLRSPARVEVSGPDGEPIQTAILDMPEKSLGMTQEEYEALHAGETPKGQKGQPITTQQEGE